MILLPSTLQALAMMCMCVSVTTSDNSTTSLADHLSLTSSFNQETVATVQTLSHNGTMESTVIDPGMETDDVLNSTLESSSPISNVESTSDELELSSHTDFLSVISTSEHQTSDATSSLKSDMDPTAWATSSMLATDHHSSSTILVTNSLIVPTSSHVETELSTSLTTSIIMVAESPVFTTPLDNTTITGMEDSQSNMPTTFFISSTLSDQSSEPIFDSTFQTSTVLSDASQSNFTTESFDSSTESDQFSEPIFGSSSAFHTSTVHSDTFTQENLPTLSLRDSTLSDQSSQPVTESSFELSSSFETFAALSDTSQAHLFTTSFSSSTLADQSSDLIIRSSSSFETSTVPSDTSSQSQNVPTTSIIGSSPFFETSTVQSDTSSQSQNEPTTSTGSFSSFETSTVQSDASSQSQNEPTTSTGGFSSFETSIVQSDASSQSQNVPTTSIRSSFSFETSTVQSDTSSQSQNVPTTSFGPSTTAHQSSQPIIESSFASSFETPTVQSETPEMSSTTSSTSAPRTDFDGTSSSTLDTILPSSTHQEGSVTPYVDLRALFEAERHRLNDKIDDQDDDITLLTILVIVLAVLLGLLVVGFILYRFVLHRRSGDRHKRSSDDLSHERRTPGRRGLFTPQSTYDMEDVRRESSSDSSRAKSVFTPSYLQVPEDNQNELQSSPYDNVQGESHHTTTFSNEGYQDIDLKD